MLLQLTGMGVLDCIHQIHLLHAFETVKWIGCNLFLLFEMFNVAQMQLKVLSGCIQVQLYRQEVSLVSKLVNTTQIYHNMNFLNLNLMLTLIPLHKLWEQVCMVTSLYNYLSAAACIVPPAEECRTQASVWGRSCVVFARKCFRLGETCFSSFQVAC